MYYLLDIFGTIAFAISGVLIAMNKKMDPFGILIIAFVTAIADEIADLGDAAGCQFGLVDHFGDLATDPRFQMIDGKYVEAEAASMRRIKAMFDQMIEEGTDISLEAMEKMLDEMSDGQRGSLKFEKGSSKDDLFGDQKK